MSPPALRCVCDSPVIRCDHRGCHCTYCGLPEPRNASASLQAAVDATRTAITESFSDRRVRIRVKIAEFLQTRDESIFTGTDLDTDEQERADSADEILNLIDEELT